MMFFLGLVFNIFFIILSIEDLLYREVSEVWIRLIFIVALIKIILLNNYIVTYISVSIYVLPFYTMIILSYYLNKELVGIGDYKLILIISMFISNDSILNLINFYFITYLVAFLYAIVIYRKSSYIPLIPCFYISYLIGCYL